MKNIFSTVFGYLSSFGDSAPQGHDHTRIKLLSGLITGMINKGNSSLPDIGSGLPQDIDANSKTTAAERFVRNKWVDCQTHYMPFIIPLLKGIMCFTNPHQGIVLIIDGSQMGKNNAALMISIVFQKRAIPLCWYVKEGSKGHFSEQEHIALVQQAQTILTPLLPQNMVVTLLGDGEFDGTALLAQCTQAHWSFVCRTACDSVFYEQDCAQQERFQARNIAPPLGSTLFFIPKVLFTEKRYDHVNFVVWHNRKKYKDPLFLISNLPEPLDIIRYYKFRFRIEALFKDLKSNSFNLHKTRLKDPRDVSRLIIIGALAFVLLFTLALKYDTVELRKKVHRVRADNKVVCSLFTFAYKLIDYFVRHDISFNFSFQFSKNNYEISSP